MAIINVHTIKLGPKQMEIFQKLLKIKEEKRAERRKEFEKFLKEKGL